MINLMVHITRYGTFKFLMMPFDLTNTPTIFYTLMNQLFKKHLDKFVIIYLDDIIVYSQMLKKHVKYVRIIFKISGRTLCS